MKILNDATVTKRKLRMTITTTRRTIAKNEGTEVRAESDGPENPAVVKFLPKSPFVTSPLFGISEEPTEEVE